MAEPVAVVTVSEKRGRETIDIETRAKSLRELYEACRDAPPSRVVRVSLPGPEGEVRLNFASFIRKA